MLYLNVELGDSLSIGDGKIIVHFEKRSAKSVRVGIDAPRDITLRVVPGARPQPWEKGLKSPTNNQPRKSEAEK